MAAKAIIIYALCRVTGSEHDDAIRIAFLLPQGGEFGFVLFSAAGRPG
jgi:CPA2 family monovalent cation:H+ antiporter-2